MKSQKNIRVSVYFFKAVFFIPQYTDANIIKKEKARNNHQISWFQFKLEAYLKISH
jgi:hypothetical protein